MGFVEWAEYICGMAVYTLSAVFGGIVKLFSPPEEKPEEPSEEKKFWEWFENGRGNSSGRGLHMSGSKIYILKQDPSVKVIGTRMKWIRDEITSGPKTNDIAIVGLSKTVQPTDGANNFLYHPNQYDEEFQALNALGIVSNVLRMYKSVLKDMGMLNQFNWPWGNEPLQVFPSAGLKQNAYYSRKERALKFFKFRGDDGQMVHVVRSFDVVAHEMGHAVLDAIRPDWNISLNPYTNALHESIADLTAIFAILNDLDLCDSVVAHSKGNLHEHSFFPIIAEEFGTALGYNFGLRNADTDYTIQSVSSEMHDLSKVFTSAMYDILSDLFDAELDKKDYEPAIVLHHVGKGFFNLFLKALVKSPREDATFYDMAQLMLSLEKDTEKWLILNKYFKARQILDLEISKMHTVESYRLTMTEKSKGERRYICGFKDATAND